MVSAGEQVWRKKYPSMEDATSEAEELHIVLGERQGTRGFAPTSADLRARFFFALSERRP